MPDLTDLFPGFASHWIDTSAGRIFVRTGGNGPPLLLLHGYTQTNVMWHRVAPVLAKRFSLVIADLPGYGWSDVPRADESPFAIRQAFDGEDHDRGNGATQPCALQAGRPRSWWARRVSARARSSRPSRAIGDPRHRSNV